MTPELYQRLKPLYDEALDAPKQRRAQFVEEACRDDSELRGHLEALLAAHDEPTGPLDAPLVNLRNMHALKQRTLADGDVVLGRFKIARILGAGGMGEVYEAEDRLLRGVHVALKTILPDVAGDPELQKRFEREVLLAREVTHPNLCPIHEIFHCDDPPPGYLFLTMKLLPGQTLAARLREPPSITNEEGLAILRQTSLGIAAIHAAGIIHRDIKPNNIMVDGSGDYLRLWITDFGLARAYETESTVSLTGTVAGTPGYIAPELYLGHPPSKASDLFALGVVLHEVFAGEKPTEVPGTHSYAVSPRLNTQKVPAVGIHLITECIHDDPRRRCTAFAHALEVIEPELARNYYSGRSAQFWSRRRFVGAAATGLCAIAGTAWWKRDELDDLLHPLPRKRFVALLNWPRTSDGLVAPMLTGVLGTLKSVFARVEAFDRNLFVISPEDVNRDIGPSDQLGQVCDPLGANLVLAATGLRNSTHFQLSLRLLDPASNRPLRERKLVCALTEITSLPTKAVRAAASLLDLSRYLQVDEQMGPETQSTAAFTAFQSAETVMKQPNDTGLNAAIEKYKEAVEIDPHYSIAFAKLALAYGRLYDIRRDSGALDLARGNSDRALAIDPGLVDAHLARASLLEQTGNVQGALDETTKTLTLDPANPKTLLWLARIYVRLNRWSDAEHAFHRVLEERPNSWVTYNELGFALHGEGKYQEAIQAFGAASVAAPGSSMAFSNLGDEYLQVGDFAKATECLKKSLSLQPDFDAAAANISLALRYQGKFEEALPFAMKSVEFNPADDMNWLELGDCYSSLGNRQKEAKSAYLRAAKEAERHLRTDATDGPGWMLLALYRVKSGNPEDALSFIARAESLGADDMDSQLYKVRILELLGKREEALATLAACCRRGATALQIAPFPDLQSLREDPRYRTILGAKSPTLATS